MTSPVPLPTEIQEALDEYRDAVEDCASGWERGRGRSGEKQQTAARAALESAIRAALSAPPPQPPVETADEGPKLADWLDAEAEKLKRWRPSIESLARHYTEYAAALRAQFAPPSEGSPPEEKPA